MRILEPQARKAFAFAQLHRLAGCFVMPNPWDIGSARLLESLGFQALATTSAGFAFALGRPDHARALRRDEVIGHVCQIAGATDLPVSADLENGYGDTPEAVAATFRLAAETGLAGASIEDATGRPESPLYERACAAERVRAAVEAARALPFPFTVTARAENYIHGRPDLEDTICRLQAFQEAGAHVLFAPGVRSESDIKAVVGSVDRPVNVMMGIRGVSLTVTDLAALGVKRVSVGAAFCRAALAAVLQAAVEVKEHGTFTFADRAPSSAELCRFFRDGTSL